MPSLTDVCDGLEPVAVPMRVSQDILDSLHALFSYVSANILPDGVSEIPDAEGCACTTCVASCECACIQDHGHFFVQSKLQLEALPAKQALYECSESCACLLACGNRVCQGGVTLPLYVKPTACGLGLFAAANIPCGSFVCLYAGEVISQREAKARWEKRRQDKLPNYVLCLRETLSSGETLKTIIDPTIRGNLGRFISAHLCLAMRCSIQTSRDHACPPLTNCVIQPVRPIGHLVPLAAIFAKRDIQANEELSFDYADASGSGEVKSTSEQTDGTRCLCGSSKCRGWLPYDAAL